MRCAICSRAIDDLRCCCCQSARQIGVAPEAYLSGTLPDVDLLAGGRVSLPTRQFWRGTQAAPGVVADALGPAASRPDSALSPDRPRPPSLPRRGSSCDGARSVPTAY